MANGRIYLPTDANDQMVVNTIRPQTYANQDMDLWVGEKRICWVRVHSIAEYMAGPIGTPSADSGMMRLEDLVSGYIRRLIQLAS